MTLPEPKKPARKRAKTDETSAQNLRIQKVGVRKVAQKRTKKSVESVLKAEAPQITESVETSMEQV